MARVLVSILGLWLLFLILRSMIRIALINRHYRDWFATLAGRAVYAVVSLRLRGKHRATVQHPVLLWFFPAYLLSLILVYFVGAMTGFAFLYWGIGAVSTLRQAFLASGSALNTLGFAVPTIPAGQWLAIPEGALGLGIVVFLFTFIPAYQAVIREREDKTSWLYVRSGDRPTGVVLLEWCQRAGISNSMRDIWEAWESWFRMLGDTHSVLPMLTMSPSVQGNQSWVVAAAAVLDAAILAACAVETPDAESARICVRTGTRAILAIADALGRTPSDRDRRADDASRERYDAARARLRSAGIELKPDTGAAVQWDEILSLRRQYEEAMSFVARRTLAPQYRFLADVQEDAALQSH